jgi:hypothetical protein
MQKGDCFMRSPINLTQDDVEAFAAKATQLSAWLQTQTVSALEAGQTKLPPELTTVGLLGLSFALTILLDGEIPNTQCWGSGCSL